MFWNKKKKTGTSWKEVKQVFAKEGVMPVTWECGNDESLVNLHGWGQWKKNHAHSILLDMLCDRIIEKLELPNAGPLMDEGEGSVFFDADTNKLKITYSSKCVVFEMHEDEKPRPELKDRENEKISLPQLDEVEFSFYGDLFDPAQIENWFSSVVVKPEISSASNEILKQSLGEAFQPLFTSFAETKAAHVDSTAGEVVLKGCDFDGSWSPDEKTLTYNLYPSVGCLAKVADNETAVLC
jgi:hypothetical protein